MDELRAGTPVGTGNITLVPIEHYSIQSDRGDKGCWFSAHKEPVAIIICDGIGVRAVNVHANEISVDSLIDKIEGLDEVLSSLMR